MSHQSLKLLIHHLRGPPCQYAGVRGEGRLQQVPLLNPLQTGRRLAVVVGRLFHLVSVAAIFDALGAVLDRRCGLGFGVLYAGYEAVSPGFLASLRKDIKTFKTVGEFRVTKMLLLRLLEAAR